MIGFSQIIFQGLYHRDDMINYRANLYEAKVFKSYACLPISEIP